MKKILALLFSIVMFLSLLLPINAEMLYSCPANHGHHDISVIENWYYDAYDFVTDERIMTPNIVKMVNEETIGEYWVYYHDFYGNREITRSEITLILNRYNKSIRKISFHAPYGESADTWYKNPNNPIFSDVTNGTWYTSSVEWAYENGIINGVGNDCFAPERTITREEFAAMLYRYTEYLEVDTTARVDYSEFADSESVSDWAHDAMSWAVAEGLINGKPGKLLAPQDTITRAEVATVIYRFNNEVKAHRDIWDGKQG